LLFVQGADVLQCWLQAQGCRVLAAQTDGAETMDDELQQLIYGLDLSAARILRLGQGQVPPKKGVLWLEQNDVVPEWGQLSPGLVVLVAHGMLVRMHFQLIGAASAICLLQSFCLHQLEPALNERNHCCFYNTRNIEKLGVQSNIKHMPLRVKINTCILHIKLASPPWHWSRPPQL
jgi:hypothetical protein